MAAKQFSKDDPLSVPGRRIPKQERSKKTVELILSAAYDLLEEVGFSGVTMQKIADRAGINVAAVYSYFPNKYQVVAELTDRKFDGLHRMRARQYDIVLQQDGDWLDSLTEAMRQYSVTRNSDINLAVLRSALHASPALNRLYRKKIDDGAEQLAAYLEKVDPKFKGDQLARARVIAEAYIAILDLMDMAEEPARQHLLDEFIGMIQGYVRHGRK